MKHLGDITKLKGSEVPLTEIVVGGSPCQDLSVAGKRKGLAGERSGLFMEQIRLIKEMRNESFKQLSMQGTVDPSRIIPRFMVWENVPGAFSSNNGEDFRAVLEETARVKDKDAAIPRLEGKQKWSPSGCIMGDGWSIAWRVHDAQFWGVPQRRKRISLVADFTGGQLQKYYLSEKACQGILRRAKTRGKQLPEILYSTLMKQAKLLVSKNKPDAMGVAKESLSNTIESEHCQPSTIKQCCHEVYGISAYESNAMKSSNPNSGIYKADTTRTLDNNGGNPACNQGGMIVLEGSREEPYTASKASFFCKSHCDGKAETLVATDYKGPQIVCYGLDRASFNQGQNAKYNFSVESDLAQTIVAKGPGGVLTEQ